MTQYEEAQASGDETSQNRLARRMVEAMQGLSQIHPEPRVREYWRTRAEAFEGGRDV